MEDNHGFRYSGIASRDSKGQQVKLRIVITTQKPEENGQHRSLVWEGDLEILDENEYIMRISMLGEGQPQPLVDVPFATGIGHYVYIPPDNQLSSLVGDTDYEEL